MRYKVTFTRVVRDDSKHEILRQTTVTTDEGSELSAHVSSLLENVDMEEVHVVREPKSTKCTSEELRHGVLAMIDIQTLIKRTVESLEQDYLLDSIRASDADNLANLKRLNRTRSVLFRIYKACCHPGIMDRDEIHSLINEDGEC